MAGEGRQRRAHTVGQEEWRIAAELERPFHRVLGDEAGIHEVAPPDRAHNHVLGDEHVLALLALLHAAQPDRLQRLLRPVQFAGPLQQQGVLHARSEHQGSDGLLVLQFECARQTHVVETFARHEAQGDSHAQRQAEQVWLTEPLGGGHRCFCGRLALFDLVVVHE